MVSLMPEVDLNALFHKGHVEVITHETSHLPLYNMTSPEN
jgi:hypothetical protein